MRSFGSPELRTFLPYKMNRIFSRLAKFTFKIFTVATVAMALSSCEKILDYEGDCDPKYFVKFEYTMHMEQGDAFKEQVKAVDLWIFDSKTGKYVDHVYSTTADLAKYDYLLPIDVKPGEYDFVAWCGDIDNRHFKVNDEIGRNEEATCRLHKRSYEGTQAISKDNLDLLFHGKLDGAVLPDEQGAHIYTIPLIRDVNNISITLQHVSGEFDTTHKRIFMADNNGFMRHDNSLDENDEIINFHPWSLVTGSLEDNRKARAGYDDDHDGFTDVNGGSGNYMNVELSTARLMADHNPVITIMDDENGKVMFEIPVVKWLLQLRSKQYSSMDEQEYLDRKNQHELMVLLQDDGKGGWTAISVVINGWHMIDNGDIEM